jgi:tetratricopeptide (TPR) repeat protein
MELARRGDLARAITSGEAAVVESPDNAGLRLFIGLLHARRLDLNRALPHLRRAAALIPDDLLPRLELARALIGLDRLDEAEAAIGAVRGPQPLALLRVRALLLQRRGDHREAAALHRLAAARDGRDFESFGHLGACLLALGDAAGAIDALSRSLSLRPDQPALRARLAEAQAGAGRGEEGLIAARALARTLPYDPMVRVTIARLEDLLGRPGEAEAALDEALALDPACPPALLALADLMERDNRIEAFEAVMARIAAAQIPEAETALLRARLLQRRGEHRAALAAAMCAPESIAAGTRAQIIGQASDRIGQHRAAFAAFAEMNRLTAVESAGTRKMAKAYRDGIADLARTTNPPWYKGWATAASPPDRPSPAFLFGFPRSGTTLIDTMLGGHPGAFVLEERPVLHAVAERLGGIARLAELDTGRIDALRSHYFDTLDAIAPDAKGRRVIDKLPLGIADTALIHRIFPDARFVFVERHPCDVVLSGYMTRFDPRGGMANFLDLQDLAGLYDGIMSYWRQCREVFPLQVHTVRYEAMIEDPKATLRPLADFLGLAWREDLIDNCRCAKARAYIATPSYAQVTEPLYTRARGRWENYREEMAGVLPILAPWAEAMGYEV